MIKIFETHILYIFNDNANFFKFQIIYNAKSFNYLLIPSTNTLYYIKYMLLYIFKIFLNIKLYFNLKRKVLLIK